ncbi:MAG: tyrosine-type recombinase/integrase [Tenuifilaceae bacterium]
MAKTKRSKTKIVTLREKKIANGKISLYLDTFRNGARQYEFLKIYILSNPRTNEEREKNQENLMLAEKIRNSRESELLHSENGMISPSKRKIDFIVFLDEYYKQYTKKDIRMIKNASDRFKDFIEKKTITPAEITPELMAQFKDYLLANYKGDTPSSYMKRFKKILTYATKQGVFTKSPASEITCGESKGLKKEILFVDEIITLAKTDCGNPELKRAFLFCLNTGIRFCDVIEIRFRNIDLGYKLITFDQVKVTGKSSASIQSIDLNDNAITLIGQPAAQNDLVFKLPSLSSCLRTLKTWTKKAGIQKNITWHSSRHSFATNLLINNTDIKTVSSLLGHSKLEHTQKYTHTVNELKKRAVHSLPKMI